jgi:hypothetical protein
MGAGRMSMKPVPLAIGTLLANIFDAADEDNANRLMHREVASLLFATLNSYGLAHWDIHLLMKEAQENEVGDISYQPFVISAPELVESLASRRAAFREKWGPYLEQHPESSDADGGINIVSLDAVEVYYGEDIDNTARILNDKLREADVNQVGTVTRKQMRQALLAMPDRVSPQEADLLMQHLPQTEFGEFEYAAVFPHPTNPKVEFSLVQLSLLELRIGALHNAIVETDVHLVWQHLIMLLRRKGLSKDNQDWRPWEYCDVLLKAEQLCLPRIIITIIMSVLRPDHRGYVPVMTFLEACIRLIPSIFDAEQFMKTVSTVQEEMAEAQRQAEAAEMAAMTAGMMQSLGSKNKQQDDVVQDEPVGREEVEKQMIFEMQKVDDKHLSTLAPEVLTNVIHACAESCKLSEYEVRSLIGEMKGTPENPDAVPYVEFVKTWVPVIFECRERQCLKIDREKPEEQEEGADPLPADHVPKEIAENLELSSFGELLPKLKVPLKDIQAQFPLFGRPEDRDPFSEMSSKRVSSKRLSVGSRRGSTGSKDSPSKEGSKRGSTIRRASALGALGPSASKTTPEQQKIIDKLAGVDPNLRRPSRMVMGKMTEPQRQLCERVADSRRLLRFVPPPASDSDPMSAPTSPKAD